MKPKLCWKCKHFLGPLSSYARCGALQLRDGEHLVTGYVEERQYTFCNIARSYNHLCGTEGKLFEPQDKKEPEPKPLSRWQQLRRWWSN